MESTSEGAITPFNTHSRPRGGPFFSCTRSLPILNREHQGSDKESNKYSKKRRLGGGCPDIKGELGKLIFLCLRAPRASLGILRASQLQMNRRICAKVQPCYLTRIFLDASVCGGAFKLQLRPLRRQEKANVADVLIHPQRNHHNIMQEAPKNLRKKRKMCGCGDEAGIPLQTFHINGHPWLAAHGSLLRASLNPRAGLIRTRLSSPQRRRRCVRTQTGAAARVKSFRLRAAGGLSPPARSLAQWEGLIGSFSFFKFFFPPPPLQTNIKGDP